MSDAYSNYVPRQDTTPENLRVTEAITPIARRNTGSIPEPLSRMLVRVESVDQRNGSYWGLCPAHADHDPSLHFGWNEEKQTIWFVCRSRKCDKGVILEKLGLEWKDLYLSNGSKGPRGRIVATYDYTSPTGELLFQVVRYEPKRFKQRRPDGNGGWIWSLKGTEPVLYRLPEVVQAVLAGETIFLCEGEKDVDNARERLGVTATTCPMGAKKWRNSYTDTLRDADVGVVGDNDPAGREHVLKVAESLAGAARSVKVLELPDLPEKGDLSDWIESGGTREEFDSVVSGTPPFVLPALESGFGEKKISACQVPAGDSRRSRRGTRLHSQGSAQEGRGDRPGRIGEVLR